MGIYLSNMEMPKEGYVDVRIKCNGTASFAIADNPYFKEVEAFPVPPHGRLIDADEFLKNAQLQRCFRGDYALLLNDVIEMCASIIPAEEGET